MKSKSVKYKAFYENGLHWCSPVDDYGFAKPREYWVSGKTADIALQNAREAYEATKVAA